MRRFHAIWIGVWICGCPGVVKAVERSLHAVPVDDAKETWKLALGKLIPADHITVPNGFEVEMVRAAGEDEDSWVALEFGESGRVFVARESRGILRFTLDANGHLIDFLEVDNRLDGCRGLLWAHQSLYVSSARSGGVFRLRKGNGAGDRFTEREQLLETKQLAHGSEHGCNQLRAGPDGMIYLLNGFEAPLATGIDPQSPLKYFGGSDCPLGQRGGQPQESETSDAEEEPSPGGHLIRMDKDGRFLQLIAGGFRNPVDLAFHRTGEMITLDADSDRHAGFAWYRPARVLHVVSGGDYGWRPDFQKLSHYQEDSLPPVLNLGLGSPTGLEFGYETRFPAPWNDVLFAGDRLYGRILAIRLDEQGASFSGEAETFAFGRPLNVMDLDVGPDGNLYFVTGGKQTKSAIYRIRWSGASQNLVENPPVNPPIKAIPVKAGPSQGDVLRNLRKQLEYYHIFRSKAGTELALQALRHSDAFIRSAARLALENQDPRFWQTRALNSGAPAALVSLARQNLYSKGQIFERVNQEDWSNRGDRDLLGMLRACQISLARGAKPPAEEREKTIAILFDLVPHRSGPVNHEITTLLVALKAPGALDLLVDLIEASETTEDLSHYLRLARCIKSPWSLESKRAFLRGLQRLESFPDGTLHQPIIGQLRKEMTDRLTGPEKTALAKWIEPVPYTETQTEEKAVPIVNEWIVDDFAPELMQPLSGRDFNDGLVAYSKAKCVTCHRIQGNPASMKADSGPDLSPSGQHLNLRQLLVALVDPSRAIDDRFRNPSAPNHSPMPAGLLNILNYNEVIDLIAYVQSGGDKNHAAFSGERREFKSMTMNRHSMNDSSDPAHVLLEPVEAPVVEPTYFKKMSAANLEDRKRLFDDLQQILGTYPEAKLEFVGHADDSQYEETNYDIAMNRARFTAANMVYRGIPREAISFRSMGDKEPSPSGNRRVEVFVKLINDQSFTNANESSREDGSR